MHSYRRTDCVQHKHADTCPTRMTHALRQHEDSRSFPSAHSVISGQPPRLIATISSSDGISTVDESLCSTDGVSRGRTLHCNYRNGTSRTESIYETLHTLPFASCTPSSLPFDRKCMNKCMKLSRKKKKGTGSRISRDVQHTQLLTSNSHAISASLVHHSMSNPS